MDPVESAKRSESFFKDPNKISEASHITGAMDRLRIAGADPRPTSNNPSGRPPTSDLRLVGKEGGWEIILLGISIGRSFPHSPPVKNTTSCSPCPAAHRALHTQLRRIVGPQLPRALVQPHRLAGALVGGGHPVVPVFGPDQLDAFWKPRGGTRWGGDVVG